MQGEIVCYLEDNKFETVPIRVQLYGGKEGYLLGSWDATDLPEVDTNELDVFDTMTARVSKALDKRIDNTGEGVLSDGQDGILSWTVTIGTK